MADVFRALAGPTRRAILDELTDRDDQTLFELCARLAMRHNIGSSRQAISQHLDVLEATGLVRTRRTRCSASYAEAVAGDPGGLTVLAAMRSSRR
jgi:DNA-binding transcriptional ArsR family regulator